MHILRNAALAGIASASTALSQVHAIKFQGDGTGPGKIDSGLQGDSESADSTIQQLITNAMVFLGIVAVCYMLYGGFKILTAGGEEEGVTKGKTIIIQGAIGLVVIFLANSIVQFVLKQVLAPAAGTGTPA